MARRARIRNLVFVRHRRGDESESIWRAFRFNSRHVGGDALTAGVGFLVVSVLLNRSGSRAIWREWPVTIKADFVCGLAQLRIIRRAVNVVAVETGDAATIHHALHEVVALHSVFPI